jgi:hypothetical protein
LYTFDTSVFLVKKRVNTDGSSESAAISIYASVMVDEVGFPFKIDDGLMVGIGVPGYFIEDTFIDPGPIDVLAHACRTGLLALPRHQLL